MMCYSCRKYDGCELPWKCSSTMYDCSAYELEQTNEEYLKSCNTEQLAEWIVRIVDCEFCPVKKPCKKQPCKKQIEKWLKQPHNTKE